MKYEDTIKKSLVGIIILIALSLGLTMIVAMFKDVSPKNEAINEPPKPALEKTVVSNQVLPKGLPDNLPMEPNARILQNYNATSAEGTFQATRSYETSKTLAENLTLYTKYLTDNGWDISTTVNTATYKKVSGKLGMANLQISISENAGKKVKTVTIFLTQLP